MSQPALSTREFCLQGESILHRLSISNRKLGTSVTAFKGYFKRLLGWNAVSLFTFFLPSPGGTEPTVTNLIRSSNTSKMSASNDRFWASRRENIQPSGATVARIHRDASSSFISLDVNIVIAFCSQNSHCSLQVVQLLQKKSPNTEPLEGRPAFLTDCCLLPCTSGLCPLFPAALRSLMHHQKLVGWNQEVSRVDMKEASCFQWLTWLLNLPCLFPCTLNTTRMRTHTHTWHKATGL